MCSVDLLLLQSDDTLNKALRGGHAKVVQYLLSWGAKVNT